MNILDSLSCKQEGFNANKIIVVLRMNEHAE